jgi:hypothetical protein
MAIQKGPANLGTGTIDATELASASVTTAKIADASITPAKLSTGGPNWDTSSNLGIGANAEAGYGKLQVRNGFAYVNEDGIGTKQLYIRSNYGDSPAIQVSTNHPLIFATNNTERIRIPSNAGGITFPATQVASSDPNTLDDYEEGSWTPSFVGSSSNPTVVYGSRVGYYVKVGQLVYCTMRMNVSSTSGGSGNLYISGMPFAQKNSTDQFSTFSLGYHNSFATAAPTYGRWYGPGSAVFELYYMGSATSESAVSVSHLQANTQLIISFVYQAGS